MREGVRVMFLTTAVMSFSLTQDPIPMRVTQEEFRALESCVAAARDPLHCGIGDDVARATRCLNALPVPTPDTAEKWVHSRSVCIEDLPCQWWKPEPDQEDPILLLEACSTREWGVLKSLSAAWLEQLRPLISKTEFDQLLAFERQVVDRAAAAEAEERAAPTPRRGAIAGARTGAWGTYFLFLQSLLYEAQGRLDEDAWRQAPTR
jgi:hypothetical protein